MRRDWLSGRWHRRRDGVGRTFQARVYFIFAGPNFGLAQGLFLAQVTCHLPLAISLVRGRLTCIQIAGGRGNRKSAAILPLFLLLPGKIRSPDGLCSTSFKIISHELNRWRGSYGHKDVSICRVSISPTQCRHGLPDWAMAASTASKHLQVCRPPLRAASRRVQLLFAAPHRRLAE